MWADSSGDEIVRKARQAWPNSKPGTIRRNLVQLRAVYRMAEKRGLISRTPWIELPFVYDVVECSLQESDISLILDHIKWTNSRWYPLALVVSHTGCRLGEALRVRESDIAGGSILLRKDRDRKSKTIERRVPMTKRLVLEANAVIAYINTHQSLRPSSVQEQSVKHLLGRAIDQAAEAIGLPNTRVHDLRHAFAGIIASHGGDLGDIASALGHSNISSAYRYRGLVKNRLERIISGVESSASHKWQAALAVA